MQKGMSALPPKATSNATYGMSAKGQKRTLRTVGFNSKNSNSPAFRRVRWALRSELGRGLLQDVCN